MAGNAAIAAPQASLPSQTCFACARYLLPAGFLSSLVVLQQLLSMFENHCQLKPAPALGLPRGLPPLPPPLPSPLVRGVTGEDMSLDKALVGLLSKCQCWEPEGCWDGSKSGDGQSPPAGHVPRPMPAAPARIGSGRVPAARPAGVGIVFRRQDPNSHAGLEVDSLTWAGPAHSSGQILAGERLVEIDGQSIRGLDARSIARLILGPANTSVTLVFECSDGRLKSVTLTRFQHISPVTSPALSPSDCSPEVENSHRRSPYDVFQ